MENDERLFTVVRGDRVLGYAYGEEWVATALFMDDWPTFETQEEAITYWRKYKKGDDSS